MRDVSEFKEKSDLINELLNRMDLNFEPDMTREEREALDVERQTFVLRAGWNNMSIVELKELFAPKPVVEEEKRKKEDHLIFQHLKDLMKEKRIYCCLSPDGNADITVFSYPVPISTDGDPEKYVPWICVVVTSRDGNRIEKMEEKFSFKYPKDGKWQVQLDGNIQIRSVLTQVIRTFHERDESIFAADYVEYWWLMVQLDALLKLIKNAKQYH